MNVYVQILDLALCFHVLAVAVRSAYVAG